MRNQYYSSDAILNQVQSDEIAKQTRKFIKNGGKVSKHAQGETGKPYNQVSVKSKKGAKASIQAVRAKIKARDQ